MTENERNCHQLETAKQLAKGRVVSPCVSVRTLGETTIVKTCPLLDIQNGCQKDDGFIKSKEGPVICPDGKGAIKIHSESLLRPGVMFLIEPSEYANEIANMETVYSHNES